MRLSMITICYLVIMARSSRCGRRGWREQRQLSAVSSQLPAEFTRDSSEFRDYGQFGTIHVNTYACSITMTPMIVTRPRLCQKTNLRIWPSWPG